MSYKEEALISFFVTFLELLFLQTQILKKYFYLIYSDSNKTVTPSGRPARPLPFTFCQVGHVECSLKKCQTGKICGRTASTQEKKLT
ncbi:hypothetical protein BpHYR1_018673 [Brachionus plicatilis]|uniref:Uncharacterized protein n=1 Tax=Brachionus plicatilis TaxID=10195 RepID=A0A3M7T5L3_BRAPC|nr:hypothetical protein BpHYR1_018673 [Brachionus plicatilis]